MLSWIVGLLFIAGGLTWTVLAYIGGAMSDTRGDDFWNCAGKPMLFGIGAIALGAALIYWK